MAFNAFIFETTTGRIVLRDLPYVGEPSYSREVNREGSLSFKVVVGDFSVPPTLSLRALFAPWRFSVGIAWDDYIIQAGPIITSQFDDMSTVITVTCGGLWRLLNRRQIVNPAYPLAPTTAVALLDLSPSTADITYTASLHTIAKKLVQDSCSRSGFALPIDFPADIAGAATRTYPLYDLASVGQRLSELTQVDGGPDVDFAPFFDLTNPGYVRWAMRIGNPMLSQTGQDVTWDYGTGLRSISTDSDGSQMVTGVFVKGNGTEEASLIAYQRSTALTALGWPATELVDTRSSILQAATLQGHADADVSLYKNPVELWDAVVRVDTLPDLGSYSPGDFARFNIQEHRWISPGVYRQRILGYTNGGQVNEVKLILQAVEGAL